MEAAGKAYIRLRMDNEMMMPLQEVWELLSDTDHLNRFIGLYPVSIEERAKGGSPIRQSLTSSAAGLWPMAWKESPFEWIRGEWYEVYREYSKGPMKTFRAGVRLSRGSIRLSNGNPEDDTGWSTAVHLYTDVLPSGWVGRAAVRVAGIQSMRSTFLYLEKAIALRENGGADRPRPKKENKADEPHLAAGLHKLRKARLDDGLIGRLERYIRNQADDEVAELRPYLLAEAWNEPREHVLRLLLHATHAGLFNMEWRLICPNCRVPKDGAERLSGIAPQFHCDWCGIDYESDFDRYVELCFLVHPEVRKVVKSIFCAGSPAMTPHVHIQRVVEPGGHVDIRVPLSSNRWRFRVLRSNEKVSLIHGKTDSQLSSFPSTLLYTNQGWSREELPAARNSPVTIVNETEREIAVVLEMEDWGNDTATASQVTRMPEFRALFSSDVLAPGQQAGISSLTVMFTDLCGSTAYYEKVGDAPAYGYVRKMFDFLKGKVEQNGGSVVKTIGDAVMAVFDGPEQGLRTALSIQEEWGQTEGLDLRIGLHHGPAVAVGVNGINDYFGRTVNMAARIQALGGAGEIVFESDLLPSHEIKLILRGKKLHLFESTLKGMSEPVSLVKASIRPE